MTIRINHPLLRFWILMLGCLISLAAEPTMQRYRIVFRATTGTFAGDTYSGTFEVDVSGLKGTGREALPRETVRNLQVEMFGGPVSVALDAGFPVFEDGVLTRFNTAFLATSISEGNQKRNVGVNVGFEPSQLPHDLNDARWWGYLTAASGLDGFGTYDLEQLPLIPTQYALTVTSMSGIFAGQVCTGGFELDPRGVVGTGTELVGAPWIRNFRMNLFGRDTGPLDAGARVRLVDGRVDRVYTTLLARSLIDGERTRGVGFGEGFTLGQIPSELVEGPWWGYLDTDTFVDGFGTYDVRPVPVVRSFRIDMQPTSGTFHGQGFSATFAVDVSLLRGLGTETVPAGLMKDYRGMIYGTAVGPVSNFLSAVFVNGRIDRVVGGTPFPSATQGGQTRTTTFNTGFEPFQVPEDLINGRWWGYLDPATFVDGFGTYELEEILGVNIRPAVEVEFGTRAGRTYEVQSSTDLVTWTRIEGPIEGTGGAVRRFYTTRGEIRNFRVQESPL